MSYFCPIDSDFNWKKVRNVWHEYNLVDDNDDGNYGNIIQSNQNRFRADTSHFSEDEKF